MANNNKQQSEINLLKASFCRQHFPDLLQFLSDFDISQIESIYGMNLVFFQNDDFIQIDNTPVLADVDSNNLFVKNPFISVGYAFDPEKFKEDTALLYTFNTSTYVDRLTDSVKSKYPQYDYT